MLPPFEPFIPSLPSPLARRSEKGFAAQRKESALFFVVFHVIHFSAFLPVFDSEQSMHTAFMLSGRMGNRESLPFPVHIRANKIHMACSVYAKTSKHLSAAHSLSISLDTLHTCGLIDNKPAVPLSLASHAERSSVCGRNIEDLPFFA